MHGRSRTPTSRSRRASSKPRGGGCSSNAPSCCETSRHRRAKGTAMTRDRGATLVVGLILLSIVTLFGLAGATGAHVEQLLAQNEQFRENAASAASAGIEVAISRIVNSPSPASVAPFFAEAMPGTADRFEVRVHFSGFEPALGQAPGGSLVGAHFDID